MKFIISPAPLLPSIIRPILLKHLSAVFWVFWTCCIFLAIQAAVCFMLVQVKCMVIPPSIPKRVFTFEVSYVLEDYHGNVNPIGPRSCYDEGKRAAESIMFDYYRTYNLDIRVVRIFNTYGPHMHPYDGRVVTNFIRQALRGEDITIYGDGSQTRSFQYIDDLINVPVCSVVESRAWFSWWRRTVWLAPSIWAIL